MKESIKHFFPLILTILCTLSGIYLLLYSFSNIGNAFSNLSQKHPSTSIAEKLASQQNTSFPNLIYVGKTLTVGKPNLLSDLFSIKTSADTSSARSTHTDTKLYLVDAKSAKGTSLLTTLSSSEIENMEEIPSAVIYDPNEQLVYFYKSGIYTLSLRLYYGPHAGVLFECQIPVEVR